MNEIETRKTKEKINETKGSFLKQRMKQTNLQFNFYNKRKIRVKKKKKIKQEIKEVLQQIPWKCKGS